jgi:RimJ/RimL family protein N-acetyltransferase
MGKYLVGQKVRLEKFCDKHLTDKYISWLNDFEINKYLCVGRLPISKSEVSILSGDNDIRFAIITSEKNLTEEFVGTISLHKIDWIARRAEMGYMIGNKRFWGKGVASEAISLVTDYGINRLGLNKIVAGVVEGNNGSVRVLEKNGYKKYATEYQEYWLEGKFLDSHKFFILAEWGKKSND